MTRRRKNPYGSMLSKIAKKLSTTKIPRVYSMVNQAMTIAAAAGAVPQARKLAGWFSGEYALPAPTDPYTDGRLVDGLCAAAGLDDVTRGEGTLHERVRRYEIKTREGLTRDLVMVPGTYEVAAWRSIPAGDPWRLINQWREVQQLAAPVDGNEAPTEPAALAAIVEYIDAWPTGNVDAPSRPLSLAFDLALRHGQSERIAGWIAAYGNELVMLAVFASGLTLPAVARAMVAGQFRETIGLSSDELESAVVAIEQGLENAIAAARAD